MSSPQVPPPDQDSSRRKRRSFFSFSRRTKPEEATPPSAYQPPPPAPAPEDTLRPIQWSPNRLATLYVTPSERNLYLAAMSQLDQAPPPLPLWTEPAPMLPALAASTFHTSPPARSVALPTSPKLVMSPNLPGIGLQVRDEFRTAGTRPAQHALLALSTPGSLKFTGFPVSALAVVDEAIQQTWPDGVRGRSETIENLRARGKEYVKWRIELEGKVWRKQGSAELPSIRLILAVLTALGTQGWSAVNSVQAASTKADAHNLLFVYSPETLALPPAFFALSIPHSNTTYRPPAGDVEWHKWSGGIKAEGWVHPGVYRFWLGGMRRWLGGGLKARVVENVHPQLFISVINAITSAHFQLVTSLPLLPITKGRDLLIFASLPSSGVSHRDTYVPADPESGSESPVLVSPEEAAEARGHDPGLDRARELPWTSRFYAADAPNQAPNQSPITPTGVPPSPTRARVESRQSRTTPSSDSQKPLIPEHVVHRRNVLTKRHSLRRRSSSAGSAAAIKEGPAAQQAARRNRRVSAGARPAHPRGESWEVVSTNQASEAPPERKGILAPIFTALHRHDPAETPGTPRVEEQPYTLQIANPSAPSTAPTASQLIAQEHARVARTSPDRTSTSGDSIYVDAPDPAANPAPVAGIASTQLPLPFGASHANLTPLRSPRSPMRGRNLVDVGEGVGVPSMVASMGFTPSIVSAPPSDGRPNDVWIAGRPGDQHGAGSGRTKVSMG